MLLIEKTFDNFLLTCQLPLHGREPEALLNYITTFVILPQCYFNRVVHLWNLLPPIDITQCYFTTKQQIISCLYRMISQQILMQTYHAPFTFCHWSSYSHFSILHSLWLAHIKIDNFWLNGPIRDLHHSSVLVKAVKSLALQMLKCWKGSICVSQFPVHCLEHSLKTTTISPAWRAISL